MDVNGFELRCAHCGGHGFSKQTITLTEDSGALLAMGSLHYVSAFTCRTCQRIEWFAAVAAPPPAHAPLNSTGKDCPNCGFWMGPSIRICPNCKR